MRQRAALFPAVSHFRDWQKVRPVSTLTQTCAVSRRLLQVMLTSSQVYRACVKPPHPHPLSSRLIIIIRLQVPRLALRHRLSVLSGCVSRPAPWRRRPITFLCYVLSVSALRPLAKRVRVSTCWHLIGQRETGSDRNSCLLFSFPHVSTPPSSSF